MTITDVSGLKICSRCGIEKSHSNFYKDKNQSSGLRPECKECNREISFETQQKRKKYEKKRYYDNYEKMQEKNKNYRKNNPEKIKSYYSERPHYKSDIQKKYRLNNQEKLLLSYAKRRAKRRNINFDITIEDIKIPQVCPILGIELRLNQSSEFGGKGRVSPNSPSLDRINPSLGYIKNNVRVISHRANQLKNNASIEELEKVLEDLKNEQKNN